VPRLRPWHLAFPVYCSCLVSCSSSESADDYRSLIKARDLRRQFRQARMVARAVKSRYGNFRNQASATKSEKRAIFAHSARPRREGMFSARAAYAPGNESGLSPRSESAVPQS
jgi:hypothetical protein